MLVNNTRSQNRGRNNGDVTTRDWRRPISSLGMRLEDRGKAAASWEIHAGSASASIAWYFPVLMECLWLEKPRKRITLMARHRWEVSNNLFRSIQAGPYRLAP